MSSAAVAARNEQPTGAIVSASLLALDARSVLQHVCTYWSTGTLLKVVYTWRRGKKGDPAVMAGELDHYSRLPEILLSIVVRSAVHTRPKRLRLRGSRHAGDWLFDTGVLYRFWAKKKIDLTAFRLLPRTQSFLMLISAWS